MTRVGLEQADDVFDRDRLSRARVADDDHRLTLLDVEGEALQHVLRAERFVDVDETDHLAGGKPSDGAEM